MTIKVGEVGKIIRVNADFDMSGSSNLKLVFTKPDQTTLTAQTADGVTAPAVDVSGTLADGTPYSFLANEYWEYAIVAGNIDQSGQWEVHGEYIDATPKDFCGDTANFPVLPCG